MEEKVIKISLETFKMIEANRLSFDESYDEIVNRVFKRSINNSFFLGSNKAENSLSDNGLYWKGIFVRNGTKLRATYKGDLHVAVIENGRILYKNKQFKSPSAAAIEASGGVNINGWGFWEYLDSETNQWMGIINLRNK